MDPLDAAEAKPVVKCRLPEDVELLPDTILTSPLLPV